MFHEGRARKGISCTLKGIMDEGLLKQIDPAAVEALSQAADNIRVHFGSVGVPPEQIEVFIRHIAAGCS